MPLIVFGIVFSIVFHPLLFLRIIRKDCAKRNFFLANTHHLFPLLTVQFSEFITPEFRHSVQEVFDLAFSGQEKSNFEFPLITKSGSRVEVLLNATTRRDQYGNIMGVVGIGQDITQRKTVERAKMTFLASFSHELRTPLNGLLGMLELLRDDRSLNGAAHRQVVMAHNSSTILLNLINDILDIQN